MIETLRGPWKTLMGPGDEAVPLYVVPFDRVGTCTVPRTLDDLVAAASEATDVFVFSHGWNNYWKAATSRYLRFVDEFVVLRRAHWDPPNREYRPVLAGVFWPSTALVAPGEHGPAFGAEGTAADEPPGILTDLTALAEALGGAAPPRLYELAERAQVSMDEARELAEILAPALGGQDDDLGRMAETVSADELLAAWSRIPAAESRPDDEPEGFIEDGPAVSEPVAAGLIDKLDPRQVIRAATVLLMKDRAGRVGGQGVGVMLRRVLDASTGSRVHLVGHSYGGKVVLSALCTGVTPSRQVDSVLLLQPAMSALCFAPDADGNGAPGGYRSALDRCRQPVLTTFSRHDLPLTQLFHWAVRRASDLGEAVIAGAPPSRFAALGGFGPQGVGAEVQVVTPRSAPDTYDVSMGDRRIIAIRADDVIAGHGAVESPATAWALLSQVES